MATERFNPITHTNEDRAYFKLYADQLLPLCKGNVLDIGCGEGWLTKQIASRAAVESIIAVDKFIEQPKATQDIKITYVHAILPDELTCKQQFNTIISTEFVEHITQEDLEKLLPNIHKWLKDDGQFLGSTPNKLVPTINPFHLREYTKDELQALFGRYGFKGTYLLPREDLTVWILQKSV